MDNERLPIVPKLCFNWIPTYRYGLFAYRALQQACAMRLKRRASGLQLGNLMDSSGLEIPLYRVRPIAMDTVLKINEHEGYVQHQFAEDLEKFEGGKPFFPITEDIALMVAKPGRETDLINNVTPYMASSPHVTTASLALAGDYAGVNEKNLTDAHLRRKAAAEILQRELALAYECNPDTIRLHLNAVGGVIEATTRYMRTKRPGFRTCLLLPEYWDFMRLVLNYSPEGLRLIHGREELEFPVDAWLEAISKNDNDLVYLSYTSNPIGTAIEQEVFISSLDAIPDDTLFFIDCTSVDIEERSSIEKLKQIIKDFSHKNLLITKSFSKEYNIGDLRIGYAVFTRKETAASIWPFMAGYPPEQVSRTALKHLKAGPQAVIERYRVANNMLQEIACTHKEIKITGNCSNYTLVYFDSPEKCQAMKERVAEVYGDQIYPGELPMLGGGDLGLARDEIDITTMNNIPFLAQNALRLVVTPESVQAFGNLL